MRHAEITVACVGRYKGRDVARLSPIDSNPHLTRCYHYFSYYTQCQNRIALLEVTRCVCIVATSATPLWPDFSFFHQAAMHNPNVSAEAKEHSRQVVQEIQGSSAVHDDGNTEPSSRTNVDNSNKDENRVLGGYKATLKSLSFSLDFGRRWSSSPSPYRS
jgi:Conidiation protein 6